MNEGQPSEERREQVVVPPDPPPVLGYRTPNTKNDRQTTESGCGTAVLTFFGYIAANWALLIWLGSVRLPADAGVTCWVLFNAACLGLSIYAGVRFNNWGWLKGISAVLLLIGGLAGLIWSICGR